MMSYQLAIQIAIDGMVCDVLRNGDPYEKSELSFNTIQSSSIKEKLEVEFSSNVIYKQDFDEVTLSWSSQKTTLIPNAVFSESNPEDLFKLCYGEKEGDIDYNRISELSLVNVYEMPEWIKRFFVIKFPRISIQHEVSMLLRKVLNENAFKLKVNVFLYASFFQLTMVKHNELIFYSNFNYLNSDDVLYHLMFVLQQKELLTEEGTMEIVRGIGLNNDLLEEIKTNSLRIQELKKMNVSIVDNFIPKAHLLCV